MAVDEKKRTLLGDGSLKSLDFIVSPPGARLLAGRRQRPPLSLGRAGLCKKWPGIQPSFCPNRKRPATKSCRCLPRGVGSARVCHRSLTSAPNRRKASLTAKGSAISAQVPSALRCNGSILKSTRETARLAANVPGGHRRRPGLRPHANKTRTTTHAVDRGRLLHQSGCLAIAPAQVRRLGHRARPIVALAFRR